MYFKYIYIIVDETSSTIKGEITMVEINSRELKKDVMRIEILCDELLELETTKRVKIISKNLEKIKDIVHNIEQKI